MNLGNVNTIRSVILIFCFGYVQNRRKIKTNNTVLSDPNSDIYLDSLQILAKYGYNPQKHSVITGDGYVVDLFRIPRKGPPVLLVHGIADSSDSWLVLGPANSLAYKLADLGYDVWLHNTRGNKYSRGHIRNIPTRKYWNYTFEEMGTQDLPAVIDYVLATRTLGKLYYVGFSQGTTTFFIMCSLKPEYNEKVKHAVLLAPIALINNIKYPFIDILSKNLNLLVPLFNNLGIYDVFANNNLLNLYHAKVCRDNVPEKVLCELEFYISYGIRNLTNLLTERLPVIASHVPAGVSVKTFVHFFQTYLSKRFQRFDYGVAKNRLVYSSKHPPEYDLSLITVPITIMVSETDWFSLVENVEIIRKKLPNVAGYTVFNKSLDFTHLEFVYGSRAKTLVNNPVANIINNDYYAGLEIV